MKGFGKAVLIGGVLVMLGGFIAISGIILAGIQNKNTEKVTDGKQWVEKEYQSKDADAIKTLQLSLVSEDVEMMVTEDDQITIKYYDDPKSTRYEIVEKSGTLTMKRSKKSDGHFSFWGITDIALFIRNTDKVIDQNHPVQVYVPDDFKGAYDVDMVSGDVKMEQLPARDDVTANSVSGGWSISDMDITGDVKVNAVSGSIALKQVTISKDAKINTTSGDVYVDQVKIGGELKCNTISGSVTGTDVAAEEIKCETSSGDVNLKEVSVLKKFKGDSISGEYWVELADEKNEFSTDFDTVSGSCNQALGKQGSGSKEISINTSSGDIHISFAGE